jgi:prepilin-type N-terminal cleavage/methylation domain-containing protein
VIQKLTIIRRRRGFSLIEVMIGLVILLIALSAAAALSINNARLIARNQFAVHAANLAEYKLEELRNANFATLSNGNDPTPLTSNGGTTGGIFTRAWTVTENVPDLGLKTVEVVVNWQQFGALQEYRLSGVIGP